MIKTIIKNKLFNLTNLNRFAFGGGHHPKPFDWRDDHSLNPYYELDPRTAGIPNSY
jgi:hypothetical protein